MIQKAGILILIAFEMLIFNACRTPKTSVCVGNMGNVRYENTYIKTCKYEGVIFSKDYIEIPFFDFDGKYTPTLDDINFAEQILRKNIKETNKKRFNQGDGCPVIHQKLHKYKRQYFGYTAPNGDKIIQINCFWDKKGFYGWIDNVFYKEPDDTKWKTERMIVLDGCSYYWSVKVNLTKQFLFDFEVNGLA